MSSTFEALIADLTRDVQRVQPKDALQFCASWFQARLEEQRTRIRETIGRHPSLPVDLLVDIPLSSSNSTLTNASFLSNPHGTTIFTDPFEATRRASVQHDPIASNVYGARSVTGRPMFSSDGMPDPTTVINAPLPAFTFNDDPFPPHDRATPIQSPDPTTYLAPAGIFGRRTSVSAEPINVDTPAGELPVFPKTDEQMQRIRASIFSRPNILFSELDEEQERGAFNAMQEVHVGKGEVIILQGEIGEWFYVVESGRFHCFIHPEPLPPNFDKRPRRVVIGIMDLAALFGPQIEAVYEPGGSFGELALMYGAPRAATIVAMEESTVWSLDRVTFRTIILKAAHRRRTMYEHFLASVPLLSSLSDTDRSKVADALVSQVYEDGHPVVREGEMGDTFFFIEEGEATVSKVQQDGEDGEVRHVEVGKLSRGEYFGGQSFAVMIRWRPFLRSEIERLPSLELALLKLAPRAATVSAIYRQDQSLPKLKVAALDAQAFTRLLGPLRDIMERHAGQRYRD